jgi:hypothetical protein
MSKMQEIETIDASATLPIDAATFGYYSTVFNGLAPKQTPKPISADLLLGRERAPHSEGDEQAAQVMAHLQLFSKVANSALATYDFIIRGATATIPNKQQYLSQNIRHRLAIMDSWLLGNELEQDATLASLKKGLGESRQGLRSAF